MNSSVSVENGKFLDFSSKKLDELHYHSGKTSRNFIKDLDLGVRLCYKKQKNDNYIWHFYVFDSKKFFLQLIKHGF